MNNGKNNLSRDLALIIFSILLAIILVQTGALEFLIDSTTSIKFIGAFFAGIFFISIFTVSPAAVVLAEILKTNQILETAFMAASGALIGDLIIFRFVRNNISNDFKYLLEQTGLKRFKKIFHLKFFHWLAPFLGALIIASPLPDELGISLLGLSKIKLRYFIPLSYILNFSGILIIGLILKNII